MLMKRWAGLLLAVLLAVAAAGSGLADDDAAPPKAKKKKHKKADSTQTSKYKSEKTLSTEGTSTYHFDADGNPIVPNDGKKKAKKKKKKVKSDDDSDENKSEDKSDEPSEQSSLGGSSPNSCSGADSCSASPVFAAGRSSAD
jgi:ribosomal protein L12E/L44/L45/RPP1/RPP2